MTMDIKALSLTLPWPLLVASGAKQIETRSWETPYRGPVAIHASKGLASIGGVNGLRLLCAKAPFYRALTAAGYETMESVLATRGCIVAVADVVDCQRTDSLVPWRPSVRQDEYAFGDYSPNRFMWRLANVRPLAQPVPARGALGLWTWVPKTAAERDALQAVLVPTA
jgi:hypothetical protein